MLLVDAIGEDRLRASI
jgi:hypothetical protein